MSKTKNNESQVSQEETNRIMELEQKIKELEEKLASAPKHQGSQRKQDILACLVYPMTISEMAKKLETSTRNISSVLTGLRKEGFVIHTDHMSRKYLVSNPVNKIQLPEPPEEINVPEENLV